MFSKGQRCLNQNSGFGVIEVLVASALFFIIAVSGSSTFLESVTLNRVGHQEFAARMYAQEGLEAVRSLRNRGWSNVALGSHGLAIDGSGWLFSGTSQTLGRYARTITVEAVQRSIGGDIVTSGGTVDPDTLRVTSNVTWNFSPTRSNEVQLVTYLTNFRKALSSWLAPQRVAGLDLAGTEDGRKIQVVGNYAYVIRNGGTPDFAIINISNPLVPTLTGSLTLTGAPINIHVVGNYAYIASDSNNSELQIINVSNPAAPTLAGVYNAAGNTNGSGVFVSGTNAYLLQTAAVPNLYIVNVSNPAAPTLQSSLALGGTAYEIVVSGNYAYVASGQNAQELQVINVTNVASPSLVSSLDLASNTDATTLAITGNTVLIGQGANFNTVNVTTPTAPALLGTVSVGGGAVVQDISLNLASGNTIAFVGSNLSTAEVVGVNITTLATPTLAFSLNLTGTSTINGLDYSSTYDRLFGVGIQNTEEFTVISP